MPTNLFCTLLLGMGVIWSALAGQGGDLSGPFRVEAAAFYFVHPGGPLKLELTARTETDNTTGKVLCRFFDRDENLVKWDYRQLAAGKALTCGYDYGVQAPAGIYQLRCSGAGVLFDVKATPERKFGLLPLRCMLGCGREGQFAKTFFIVPPGAGDTLSIRGYGIKATVADGQGNKLGEIGNAKPVKIDVKKRSGEVLSLAMSMKNTGYYRFGSSGMPLIVCPDAATAKAINGSVEKTADGKFFAHKFQVKMYEWLKTVKPSELEMQIVPLTAREKEWQAEPKAAALLGSWGLFTHINYLLKEQNLNPDAKDFGKSSNPTASAAVLTLDKPFNPYYRNQALQQRLLVNACREYLKLHENDTFEDSDINYCGGDALGEVHRAATIYFAVGGIKDQTNWKLWAEAARRMADRFCCYRVSCENQSSHWPLIYECMAKATGEKGYLELARDYIAGLSLPENNSSLKAGYQQEAYGPDATYQGLGCCNQAVYYRLSGDDNARKGLQTVYEFFNHTVAPEPDGRIYGCSGFAHRTAGSWVNRQYNGGLRLMAGTLPEAAVWSRFMPEAKPEATATLLRKTPADDYYKRVPQILGYTTAVFSPFFEQWLLPSSPLTGAKLPMEKNGEFIRDFNGEFLAVRKPGYYALVYTGKTAPEWTGKGRRTQPDNPKPTYKWNQMQGLQMFWTPEFGNGVLSMNWNADTLAMVRADLPGGKCSFPDYWSLSSRFDAARQTLSLKWRMYELPLTIVRTLTFEPDGLRQELEAASSGEVRCDGLWEQIPVLLGKKDELMLFETPDGWSKEPGKARGFWLGTGGGQGIRFGVDRMVELSMGKETVLNGQRMGVVKVALGKTFRPGDKVKLNWTMQPAECPDKNIKAKE